jgi:hypothetical protein
MRSKEGEASLTMDARGQMQMQSQPTAKTKGLLQQHYPFYHTTDEIRSEALRISKKCGGALNVTTLSDNNTNIDIITVRKVGATPANKVFMLFGEHAREVISPESGLYFLRALCGDVPFKVPAVAGKVLEDSEFQMVLNSNPHSRQRVEDGHFCLRVNPSGVDLNRNWDEHYHQDESSEEAGESYSGAKPFSEPETRIVKRLVTEYAPTVFLTVHSGTKGMYMPWAFDGKHMASTNAKSMNEVLVALDKDHCQCPFGAAGKEVGYDCPGTCIDYAYGKLNTPFAFAFEIYTDDDPELKTTWAEEMKKGGFQLLEKGHTLGHPHFRDFFKNHSSDFVGTSSLEIKDGQKAAAADLAGLEVNEDMSDDGCFGNFNPSKEEEYHTVVKNWAEVYFQMAAMTAQKIKSGEVTKGKVLEPILAEN